jgi:hypothetical protein
LVSTPERLLIARREGNSPLLAASWRTQLITCPVALAQRGDAFLHGHRLGDLRRPLFRVGHKAFGVQGHGQFFGHHFLCPFVPER